MGNNQIYLHITESLCYTSETNKIILNQLL